MWITYYKEIIISHPQNRSQIYKQKTMKHNVKKHIFDTVSTCHKYLMICYEWAKCYISQLQIFLHITHCTQQGPRTVQKRQLAWLPQKQEKSSLHQWVKRAFCCLLTLRVTQWNNTQRLREIGQYQYITSSANYSH